MTDLFQLNGVYDLTFNFTDITVESDILNRINTFRGEYLPDLSFGVPYLDLIQNIIPYDIFLLDVKNTLSGSLRYSVDKVYLISSENGEMTIGVDYTKTNIETLNEVVISENLQLSISTRSADRFIISNRSIHG